MFGQFVNFKIKISNNARTELHQRMLFVSTFNFHKSESGILASTLGEIPVSGTSARNMW